MESHLPELKESVKILVVGVEENKEQLIVLLREIGFSGKIETVPQSPESYQTYLSESKDPFGFVICRISSYNLEGINFVTALASYKRIHEVPVFILLDHADQSIISKCFELGVAGYMLTCESHTSLLLKINEGWSKFYREHES